MTYNDALKEIDRLNNDVSEMHKLAILEYIRGYNEAIKEAMDICDNAWNDKYGMLNGYNHAMGIKSLIGRKLKETP